MIKKALLLILVIMYIFIVKIKIPSMSKGQKPIGHADDVGTQSIIV